MTAICFSKHTFRYFAGARRHADDRAWFDANKHLYEQHLLVPFTHLVMELRRALSPLLPGIEFGAKKITKPLLRKPKDEPGPVLRPNATAFFSEPATSMFEMNPGIYLSFGAKAEDNILGCGIYMPSARQLRELRPKLCSDFQTIDRLLRSSSLAKHWNGLAGEKYTRFPKDYDPEVDSAKYLWHKQFFLSKHLTQEDVLQTDFIDTTVASLKAAVPFLNWTRQAVGLYRRPPAS